MLPAPERVLPVAEGSLREICLEASIGTTHSDRAAIRGTRFHPLCQLSIPTPSRYTLKNLAWLRMPRCCFNKMESWRLGKSQ